MMSERKKIHVVSYHHKLFVVGLTWRTLTGGRHFMKAVRRTGREENFDVVAVRQHDSVQAGFAAKTDRPLSGCYSLAGTLAALIPGRWAGVFPLNPQEYILIACADGTVFPSTDKVITEEAVGQEISHLKTRLAMGDGDFHLYGDRQTFSWVTADISLNDILTAKNLKQTFKLRQLTRGLTKQQIYAATALCSVLLLSTALFNSYQDMKAEEENTQRAEARHKATVQPVKPPWTTQASVSHFIHRCHQQLHEIPLSLGGWVPVTLDCTPHKVALLFARKEGSAVGTADFKKRVERQFHTTPAFNMQQPGVASFSLTSDNPPEGDDLPSSLSEQLDKFITLLQRHNLAFTLTPEPTVAAQGNTLTPADRGGIAFSYDSAISPGEVFKNADVSGMRINHISLSINSELAQIRYKVKGVIYFVNQ